MIFWNSAGSITSKISSISLRNMTYSINTRNENYMQHVTSDQTQILTSLGECVFGQYFNRDRMTGSLSEASFSKNWTTQYANCGWYADNDFTLCNGSNTFNRNTLCSSFRGRANPFIILKTKKTKKVYWTGVTGQVSPNIISPFSPKILQCLRERHKTDFIILPS